MSTMTQTRAEARSTGKQEPLTYEELVYLEALEEEERLDYEASQLRDQPVDWTFEAPRDRLAGYLVSFPLLFFIFAIIADIIDFGSLGTLGFIGNIAYLITGYVLFHMKPSMLRASIMRYVYRRCWVWLIVFLASWIPFLGSIVLFVPEKTIMVILIYQHERNEYNKHKRMVADSLENPEITLPQYAT